MVAPPPFGSRTGSRKAMEVIQSLCPCRASGREEDSFSRSKIRSHVQRPRPETPLMKSKQSGLEGKTPNPSYQTQTIKPRITAGRGTFSTATRAKARFSPGSTSSGLARSSTYQPTRALNNSSTRALYSQPRPDASHKVRLGGRTRRVRLVRGEGRDVSA